MKSFLQSFGGKKSDPSKPLANCVKEHFAFEPASKEVGIGLVILGLIALFGGVVITRRKN